MSDPLSIARQWVALAIPELGSRVIYADQDVASAPRPAKPYATVKITASRTSGSGPYIHTTTTVATGAPTKVVRKTYYHRVGTLTVTVYGASARLYAETLEISLNREAVKLLLAPAPRTQPHEMISIGNVLSVTEQAELLDVTSEDRGEIDLEIGWVQIDQEAVPWLSGVVFNGSIT